MKIVALVLGLLLIAAGVVAQNIGIPRTGGPVPADLDSLAVGIVAKAGGGKATATQLVGTINVIATVATAADSVILQPCLKAPQRFLIFNQGANSVQIFGSGTDTIDGVATATGVPLAAAGAKEYVCTTPSPAAAWLSH